jgi:hypothetical protein
MIAAMVVARPAGNILSAFLSVTVKDNESVARLYTEDAPSDVIFSSFFCSALHRLKTANIS